MATHKDEAFEDATVDLDGETFENCTCAASNTALFMRALSEAPGGDDIIRQNFPALFKNH